MNHDERRALLRWLTRKSLIVGAGVLSFGALTRRPLRHAHASPALTSDRIVAIGDSVMLGAKSALEQMIPAIYVDAAVSRQISAVTEILWYLATTGQLSDITVVHTGNNGPMTFAQFDAMMQAVAGCSRVILLNNKEPRSWEQDNDNLFAYAVPLYPNAQLIDWWSASINHPEYFGADDIHLTPTGAYVYASLIAGTLAY